MDKNNSFLRNHADTMAIIGVNIAIGAILLSICLTNISSINAANARMDTANARMDTLHVMFYDLLNKVK